MSELAISEEKIIHSAIQVFIEKGFEKAKMQDIAESAGISRTNLNYYFRTKENLFHSIVDKIFESLIPQLEHILDDEELEFMDKIFKLVDAYSSFLQKNQSMPFFIISEINRTPHLVLEFLNKSEKLSNYLEKLRKILLNDFENLNQVEILKKPVVEIISLLYGMVFTPYLLSPVVNNIYEEDEKSINEFFKSHAENVKYVLTKILS